MGRRVKQGGCPAGRLQKAIQGASSRLRREVRKHRSLDREFDPVEIWASVSVDGCVQVGTPVLRPGEGYYVNHRGEWERA